MPIPLFKILPISSGSFGCCILRGDIDHSGSIDISDLVVLVTYMFQSSTELPCLDEADIDNSGGLSPIDISDLVALVSYIFLGSSAPVNCP